MANPVLNERVFNSNLENDLENTMTINGTILKTCFLGLLMAITFSYNWTLLLSGFLDKAKVLFNFGLIGGLILCFIICFAPKNKFLMFTTSLYALCEGLVLGMVSAFFNVKFPGLASQAIIGTIFALFGMFLLYKTNIIKCTDRFRNILFITTFGVFGIYLLQYILSFFHLNIPALFSNSAIGIGFSIIVVAIASFHLIVDFNLIENLSGKVEKHYEWYCGFSLLVTIVWMYIEILNLLAKLQSRNN